MKRSVETFVFFTCLLLSGAALSRAAELADLVAPGAKAQKVAGDCKFTEGPAWSPQGFLLFSDIPNDRIVQLLPDGTTKDFLNPSERANGLMFNRAGQLFACQGGARRVVMVDLAAANRIAVLADGYEGKKLNSPNDLALDAHGGLYFTDPYYGPEMKLEQPVMGVYYLDAGRKRSRVIEDLRRPNGILVSPSGQYLYVAEPDQRELYRYRIEAPGKLAEKKLIFTGDPELDGGGPDGMAHDALGNIYASYQGITVLDPEGKLIGRIPVPEHPANCAFGGKENKTLYITARTSLYALELKVAGMALQESPPPAPGAAAEPGAARAEKKEVKAGALKLKVPAAWKEVKADSSMRVAQLEVPKAPGDEEAGEFVVFHFGAGGAGGARANVERWIGQFSPEGRKSRVMAGKCPTGEYTLVEVSGTYNKSVGPIVEGKTRSMPGARLLGAVLKTGEGTYYLKFTGPEKTVAAAAEDFRASFGGSAKEEKESKSGSS
ncbi:MAG: SMP-30/gluconolactonase/LRE family protein [Planctomycetes bacterium]|nr:SMP-30/gluconolactonase/LRE family protein [Planctomycetota bacterium]